MTKVLAADPRVSSSYYDTIFSLAEKTVPSGVAILFSIDLKLGKTYKNCRKSQVKRRKLQVFPTEFLGKCADGILVSVRPLCPVDAASDESSSLQPGIPSRLVPEIP